MIFSKSLKCLLFFLNSFKIKCCPWFLLLVLGCTVFNLVRFVIIYRQGVYVLCKTRVTKPWMIQIVFYNRKDVAIEIEIPWNKKPAILVISLRGRSVKFTLILVSKPKWYELITRLSVNWYFALSYKVHKLKYFSKH